MMVSSIARFPFFSKVQFNKREPGVCAELSKVFRLVSAIVRTALSQDQSAAEDRQVTQEEESSSDTSRG